MISRRDFIKVTAAFGGALLISRYVDGVRKVFAAPIPGGVADNLIQDTVCSTKRLKCMGTPDK